MLADLVDLVVPRVCAGCAAPGQTLCARCASLLGPPFPHRPDPCPPGLPALVAAASYDGAVRMLMVAHKERGRRGLTRPLGAALAAAVAELDPPPGVLLVPVPSSRAAVRARGHDHARRLAVAAVAALPGSRTRPLLGHVRAVADQAELDAGQRAANLAHALRAAVLPAGLPVVVIDDVVTTGATLAEAARALLAAGADVRGAAVVAATSRRAGTGRPRRGRVRLPDTATGGARWPERPLSSGPVPG